MQETILDVRRFFFDLLFFFFYTLYPLIFKYITCGVFRYQSRGRARVRYESIDWMEHGDHNGGVEDSFFSEHV